jgi:hypothetical protein
VGVADLYELDDCFCVICLVLPPCLLEEGLLLPRVVYVLWGSCLVVFFREERNLPTFVVFPEYFFVARLFELVYRFATYVSDPFCFE